MLKLVILLTINLSLFFSHTIFAQHIQRKGKLGVQLAQATTNEWGAKFQIKTVFPNSTAASLQLQTDDLVLKINGEDFQSGADIQRIIGQFYEGNPVQALVIRDGQRTTLSGKVVAPPLQATHPSSEIILGEVPFKDGYIRSFINKPKGKGPFKTIFYIQGYPCQSIDQPNHAPMMRLIDAFVKEGYAVYRVEKPGIGEFHQCAPCQEQTFDDELLAFENAYKHLLEQSYVDQKGVYLFGHSLGGNVAPILGKKYNPAGIIVYGTLLKPWTEYLVDMARYSQPLVEEDVTLPEQSIPLLKKILHKVYVQDILLVDLEPKEKDLLRNWHDMAEDQYLFQRHNRFWKNFARHNFVAHWNEVKVPVLSLYGSTDVHAISSVDAELIANIVEKNNPGMGQFKLIDRTDHLFAQVDTKLEEMEYIQSGSLGQMAASRFNTDFPPILIDWIHKTQDANEHQQFTIRNKSIPQELTKMSTMDVEAADLDGDGHKDLILASEFGPNRILFYTPNGFQEDPQRKLAPLKEYQLPYQGEDSEDIALGDFNQDGKIDLLFVSEDTDAHELYYNKGRGQFSLASQQIPKTGQANAVLVYDFNQDQYPDILIGIRGRNELYINLKGKGFQNQTDQYWTGNQDSTQDLILVDVDQDGDADLVEGIEEGGSNLYVNENGVFTEQSKRLPDLSAYETRKVGAFDADLDGDLDLFFCNVGWNPVRNAQNLLLINDGKGFFKIAEKAIPKANATTLDVLFIDVDKDGKKDIITTGMGNDGNLQVLLNQSQGEKALFKKDSQTLPSIPFGDGISLIAADFANNGKLGIYVGNFKFKDVFITEK